MMGARLAASAAAANPNAAAPARTPIVAGDAAREPMAPNRRGITNIPTMPLTVKNATASATVPSTLATSTDPSLTMRVTTVRMMRPSTSSATAAPRTMRASVELNARKSLNTRAVIPTLVAANAAPRKRDAFIVSPSAYPAITPALIGNTTPITATPSDARPTRRSSTRSISRPT